jgi:hypothetical protein
MGGNTNHDVRVPGVYLTSAFLAFLYFLSERRMNNLRVCNGLDGSIPTAPTITPDDSVALTLPGRVKRVEKAAFCCQVPGRHRLRLMRSASFVLRSFQAPLDQFADITLVL